MEVINALGRRKRAIARVFVTEGTGKITINKRDLTVYFPSSLLQYVVLQPLKKLDVAEKYDIKVNLNGGGYNGQANALRLAIARAIVKNAEICIFDDSFSALDLATDARLRASLRENLPDTNIIIVAQRVGTVINADRIIVMDDGKAVGIGTHSELLENCEIYKSIVDSQISDDEEVEAV